MTNHKERRHCCEYFMTRRDRDEPMIVMVGSLHGHWMRGGTAEYGRNGWVRSVSPIKLGRGVWAKWMYEVDFAHKVEKRSMGEIGVGGSFRP